MWFFLQTSRVLGATLYYLAKNKSAQENLRNELKQRLPNKNSPITNEILEELHYLKAVLKETTRLAPVTPGGMRTLTEDTIFCGYKVPKGVRTIPSKLSFKSPLKSFRYTWVLATYTCQRWRNIFRKLMSSFRSDGWGQQQGLCPTKMWIHLWVCHLVLVPGLVLGGDWLNWNCISLWPK